MARQGQSEKMNKERERNMAIMRETDIKINCKKRKKRKRQGYRTNRQRE